MNYINWELGKIGNLGITWGPDRGCKVWFRARLGLQSLI